ncbi:MAG: hypothetical protein JWN69_523 [Alphaproteobacteria bacterium]|nr:hypothetical protein [Alphaproteobacteria bacterium]
MALTPKDNEAFYREVDEELRRDQVNRAMRRYGVVAGILILLFLAAVGGYLWWQQQKEAQASEQAEKLNGVFEDIGAGRTSGIDARLDAVAGKGGAGYRAAALLTKADLAVQAGNDAAAIAGFMAVAQDEDFARPYRDLALIRQTALEFDTLAPAAVIERLKPMAVAGNPWFGSAGEMVAIAHLKQQKPELAGPIFAAMAKDESVPRSIRSRAREMAGSLGIDAVDERTGASARKGQ